ncbi:MAG TPA: response regulator [Pyrinomonadaceae bacterium]
MNIMTRENSEKPTILIIDDDEQIRRLLKDLLGPNADCTTVGSAEDALALLKSVNFNLVISDINMGGISGLDLVPRVLKQTPDTVVVMISQGFLFGKPMPPEVFESSITVDPRRKLHVLSNSSRRDSKKFMSVVNE